MLLLACQAELQPPPEADAGGERLNLAITMLLQSTIATNQRASAPSMHSANEGKWSGFQVFSEPRAGDADILAGAVG